MKRETFYCRNCRAHFYLSEEETQDMISLRSCLLEADRLAIELGFDRYGVPTTFSLYQKKAKCCDHPDMNNKYVGEESTYYY